MLQHRTKATRIVLHHHPQNPLLCTARFPFCSRVCVLDHTYVCNQWRTLLAMWYLGTYFGLLPYLRGLHWWHWYSTVAPSNITIKIILTRNVQRPPGMCRSR